MLLRVAVLVFLFLAKLRFPHTKSVAQIIRSRYGEKCMKSIRKFEKLDYRLRKAELDLGFLLRCKLGNIIPNFLRFRLANRSLQSSVTYKQCQLNLLNEEIRSKKSHVRILKKEFYNSRSALQQEMSLIDFAHVTSLFLSNNDRSLKTHDLIQQKKFSKLSSEQHPKNDPSKVIFNFSNYELSDSEKSLLVKGLNFSIPPRKLNYADYLVNYELFYRDIRNLDMLSNENLDFLKTKVKDAALSSYRNYNENIPQHLNQNEFNAMKSLSQNKDLIVQKSDKGNSVVVIYRSTYNKKMEMILSDHSKFLKLYLPDNNLLKFSMNQEKLFVNVLKTLKDTNKLSEQKYRSLKPKGTRPGIMYGLSKVHKKLVDGSPPLRPILSALKTPAYKLAKFLVPLLCSTTVNEYSVKDSFHFSSEILEQDSSLYMGSLDVDSLFTNIPLEETIDICVNGLFNNVDTFEGFNKSELKKLLTLATKESHFLFNNTLYKQVDGVAMGSPLGPTLANAFLAFHEKQWLKDCPKEFKPVYYRRYVDDIFVLFKSHDHLLHFRNYLNSKHQNISFSFECESNNKMSFLDVEISREQGKFKTTIYRKPTFSGVYTHFDSFLPNTYKFGMIYTLAYRCFRICSNWTLFHNELQQLKEIFRKNEYPESFVDNCFRKFLDNAYQTKQKLPTAEKKTLTLVLPYLGVVSLQTRTKLQQALKGVLNCCKLRVIFKTQYKLSSVFRFKDCVPKELTSGVIYKFQCGLCNETYYGETVRHLDVRSGEHIGISPLTNKKVKAKESSIKDHLLFCNHTPSLDDFSVLAHEDNKYRLEIKESLLIKRDKPSLNKNISSAQLFLFDKV